MIFFVKINFENLVANSQEIEQGIVFSQMN